MAIAIKGSDGELFFKREAGNSDRQVDCGILLFCYYVLLSNNYWFFSTQKAFQWGNGENRVLSRAKEQKIVPMWAGIFENMTFSSRWLASTLGLCSFKKNGAKVVLAHLDCVLLGKIVPYQVSERIYWRQWISCGCSNIPTNQNTKGQFESSGEAKILCGFSLY